MSDLDASTTPVAESKPETPLLKKIIPVRGAARKAAENLKQQNTRRPRTSTAGTTNETGEESDSDAADVAEDEREETADAPVKRRQSDGKAPRGRGRPRGRPRGRGGASRGDLQRTPARRQSTRPLKALDTSLLASSSPLTSPEYETPQKRSRPSTSRSPSKRTKAAVIPRDADPSGSFLDKCLASKPSGSHENIGDFYAKGDLVWVRLNLEGETIDDQKDIESESYWWPARVTGDKILQVDAKLFGDDGHGEDRLVNISSISQFTILSFRNGFGIRFSPADFTISDSPPDVNPVNPFEAQTSTGLETPNLTSRWKAALDLALASDEDEELPDPLAVLSMTMSVNRKGKRSMESEETISTPSPKRRRKSSPTPLDAEIRVGETDGELVLAREHKDRRDYWPAKVVGVAQDKRGKWMYEVCFMDGKKKRIRRELFFSSDQEGFATCKIGEWNTKLAPSDTEGADTEDELRNRDAIRSPSPSPTESDLEDIADRESFGKLPLQDQMRYVYPFLCRIIRREYQPSFGRHDAFMRGGKSRGQLGQTASLRGEFSDNEMKKVSALVRKAMLRSERWAERIFDGDTVRNEEESTIAHASDGTKAESLAESTQSPVFDAALALTELKSSEYNPPTAETFLYTENDSAPEIHAVSSSEIDVDPPMPPPSSFVSTNEVDESSDMEMGSDDEDDSLSVARTPQDATGKDEETAAEIAVSPVPVEPSYVSPTVPRSPETGAAPEASEESPSDVKVATAVHRARPTGCLVYENLPRSDRGLYCADVLLPEAVLQLHLLRAGRRTSAHLLAPEEETKLYEEGQDLLQTEVPWLIQIVQLRKVAERALKRNVKKKATGPAPLVQGGTSSRPKVLKAKD